jgi:hypothetical protein
MTWEWTRFRSGLDQVLEEDRTDFIAYGKRSDGMVFQIHIKAEPPHTEKALDVLREQALKMLDTFLDCACVVGQNCERHSDLAA